MRKHNVANRALALVLFLCFIFCFMFLCFIFTHINLLYIQICWSVGYGVKCRIGIWKCGCEMGAKYEVKWYYEWGHRITLAPLFIHYLHTLFTALMQVA